MNLYLCFPGPLNGPYLLLCITDMAVTRCNVSLSYFCTDYIVSPILPGSGDSALNEGPPSWPEIVIAVGLKEHVVSVVAFRKGVD